MRFMISTLLWLVIMVGFDPKVAIAQEKLDNTGIVTDLTKVKSKTMTFNLNGHPGIWFPELTAKQLLVDIKTGKAVEGRLKLTEERLELEKQKTNLLSQDVLNLSKQTEEWKKTADLRLRHIESLNKWWKSPYLWLAVGFVAGSGITIGIAYATK